MNDALPLTTTTDLDVMITQDEFETQFPSLAAMCADLPITWIVDDQGDPVCNREELRQLLQQVFRPE